MMGNNDNNELVFNAANPFLLGVNPYGEDTPKIGQKIWPYWYKPLFKGQGGYYYSDDQTSYAMQKSSNFNTVSVNQASNSMSNYGFTHTI